MAASLLSRVIEHLRSAVPCAEGAERTDAQLLESFVRCHQHAALEALVRRHGPMVWGVCHRILRHQHDAEDAFQATFLVLVRKAAAIQPREMVANWLYGVARQTALKARAMRAKRQGRERQVQTMPEPQVEQHAELWPELQPLLDEELGRLPDKYRVAIVLCDLEGKTRTEAARQLGYPEGTVATRLRRARALLARRLARRGLALTGGALAMVLSQKAAAAAVPAVVLSATIKVVTLVAAGQSAVTGLVSARVVALTEGVMKAMFLSKLKAMTSVLLVLAVFAVGASGLIHWGQALGQTERALLEEQGKAEGGSASRKKTENDEGKKTKKEPREGTLLADLEKVDPREWTITVTRSGVLIGGLGDPQRGGIGIFSKTIRLENLPVAPTARILVSGKKAKLTDLKPGMPLSLKLAVKGGITVQEITAESKAKDEQSEKKPAQDTAAREVKLLQGEWRVVGLVRDGKKASADELKGGRWIFKGAEIFVADPGRMSKMAEFKLDSGTNPRNIDLFDFVDGRKVSTILGIYKWEKGRLIICWGDKKGRPTQFTTDVGSGQGLITLEKKSSPADPSRKADQ
jgi:RNA polymerase sigma factor (sigma-70 family)